MSKFIDWGNWLVAAIFAANGLLLFGPSFFSAVTSAVKGRALFYPPYLAITGCVAFLLCAWGILKWRRWGLTLGIILSVVEVGLLVFFTVLDSPEALDPHAWIFPIVNFAVLIWLLLPAVRTEFSRRNRTA